MESQSLQTAFEWTSGVVGQIKPDQLDVATPCRGWTVRMLLNHMIGANRAFASGVPRGEVDPKCDPAIDIFEDDPGPVYDTSWAGAVQAWSDADADGATVFPWGPMPNSIAQRLLFCESTVHGWDLITATGQGTAVPDDLVEPTYQFVTILFEDPANRGTDFAAPVPVAADASATARLVAFLGRQPT
jgi:uncharacterized protein (TIGR03086 family)